jgi:hypothetical protein
MTKEQIEQVAKEYATAPLGLSGRDSLDEKEFNAFVDGATWALDNLSDEQSNLYVNALFTILNDPSLSAQGALIAIRGLAENWSEALKDV